MNIKSEIEKVLLEFLATKPKLNNKLWEEFTLKKDIEKKLLELTKEIQKELGIDFEYTDIHLTGSNCNFNYNKFSDIDLHFVFDSKQSKEPELLKKYLDLFRKRWNENYEVKIKGIPVELYFQDIKESHTSSGIYSLSKHKWVSKPVYEKIEISDEEINKEYDKFKKELNKVLKTNDFDSCEKLREKIVSYRKKGLSKKSEEFSVENIVFKKLRDTKEIKKLLDHIQEIKNKELSLD